MKAKHAVILLILGLCTDFVGALFKIQHWAGGSELLVASTVLKVAGALLLLYKLLTHPRVKEFLNR